MKAPRILARLALFFSFSARLVWAPAVWAQSTAQIVGTVTDASGAAVPGAEVKATQTDTGVVRTFTSGPAGEYVLNNLANRSL